MASAASSRLDRLRAHLAGTEDGSTTTLNSAECAGIAPPPNPGHVLFEERGKATFPVRKLTYFLDGGEQWTQINERIMLELERDPLFQNEDRYDLTKDQTRERTMRKVKSFIHHILNDSETISRQRFNIVSLVDPGFMTRMGVHFGLFFQTLRSQGTSEQIGRWVEAGALNLKGMYGCFSMTELGHGSNVPGLETTATFDARSDEFIIHTPTLTATKWWIGGAAQSATVSVVFAQLIVDGKRYGVKPFIVPLRDAVDFSLKPGIAIGDCGAKMGRNGIDNGWIQFTNVRIPRENMLMRHTQVDPDGKVTQPPMQQLAYGALIGGRVQMVMDSANVAKLATTIAVRYGTVRRQFAHKEGQPEQQIINYASHQYRLMPLLALTFAMHFGGVITDKNYSAVMEKLEGAQPGEDMTAITEQLKAVHATSAGLKAFCTWNTLELIEQCRQALGGHGYSSYAGLASLYADFAVQCSWEGDNTIMMLQNGRYLINCYREAKKGAKLPPAVGYLNGLTGLKNKRSAATTKEDLTQLAVLEDIYDAVCAHLVQAAGQQYEAQLARGVEPDAAYEECAVPILTAARAHIYGFLLHRFAEGVAAADRELQAVLTKVAQLYAMHTVSERIGTYALQYQVINAAQFELIRNEVFEYCKLVRQDCIPLTDAFNYTDFVIGSPLGRYDGDIYRSYFNQVTHAPGAFGVPPYFETVTKKLFERNLDV